MKNCRRKIKKGINGSLWSDADFDKRIANAAKPDGKSASMNDDAYDDVVTEDDEKYASLVAKTFASDEQDFYKMLSDTKNWAQEGESEDGTMEVDYDGTEKD
jgi:hypothetical protein